MPRKNRGPTPFFHGRTEELASFDRALGDTHYGMDDGTIFIVQGAPGVGITALLHECAKRARSSGWRTVDIKCSALHDSGELARTLGLTVGVEADIHADVYVGRKYRRVSVEEVLQIAVGPNGMVLVLDEAQDLRLEGRVDSGVKASLVINLDRLLNGSMGVPVVLLAGGLGTTQDVIGSFGIARFPTRGVYTLGALEREAARDMVRDWLVWSGGAPKDHSDLPSWLDILVSQSDGWPQNLYNYAYEAVQWAKKHDGKLTPQVPESVLVKGRESCEKYYAGQVTDVKRPVLVALANMAQQQGQTGVLSERELVAAFAAAWPTLPGEESFDTLLYKGVIARTRYFDYCVPIPSMQDWLVDRYAEQ